MNAIRTIFDYIAWACLTAIGGLAIGIPLAHLIQWYVAWAR